LIQSFGIKDQVKAGHVWNTFSKQLQLIINLETATLLDKEFLIVDDETQQSPQKPRKISDSCRNAKIPMELEKNETQSSIEGNDKVKQFFLKLIYFKSQSRFCIQKRTTQS
jgi:hypothetical protein